MELVNGIPIDIIATGSTGNAIIVDHILIDCGCSWRDLKDYANDISLVFISHEHQDHMRSSTVRRLVQERPTLRWAAGGFLYDKLLSCGVMAKNVDVIKQNTRYHYGQFSIKPVPLHHDVPNYGIEITFPYLRKTVFYATDTAYIGDVECRNADVYLVESNYVEEENNQRKSDAMAAGGYWYAPELRHLSFEQAAEWIDANQGPNSVWIPIHGHGGETNANFSD